MDDREIFVELHPALRRFAAAIRPPDVDTDDLLQEALARTLRRGRLADLDDPARYLRRVLVNLAASHRRTFGRRSAASQTLARDAQPHHDRHSADLADLLLVPVEQRAVIYLSVVEGLSHAEIADLLAITADTSRARLSRGLRQLRVALPTEEVPR